jgi:cytochrome c peroxidase
MKQLIALLFVFPMLFGCSKDTPEDAAYTDIPLELETPSNFPPLAFDLENNPITLKGFELGRKLFYDGRLSSDGTVSCGFCHEQRHAFTHHGHTVSQGVHGQTGTRNTPSIQNLAFQDTFMYDGATDHLNLQPLIPLTSPMEMDGNLTQILAMMKADPEYQKLFAAAFPGKPINTDNMLKAMGQFMAMVVSANSKFDKFRRNETGGTLTADEQQGYVIFNQKCASCHATDLFTDHSFRNNGLAVNPQLNDVGRYRVSLDENDRYKFKVPSLRNVEKTAPYMHDGRFFTLESVLNHYSSGIVDSATLDPSLNNNGTLGIPLTESEKTKIIAFLKTLTDEEYLKDKRFSE